MSWRHAHVLKKNKYLNKITILGADLGKNELIVNHAKVLNRLSVGMEILFTTKPSRLSTLVLSDFEVMNVPIMTCDEDVYWLHHFLELHDYFLSYGDAAYEDFLSFTEYLKYSFSHKLVMKNKILRLLCVVHFLARSGLYDHHYQAMEKYAELFEKTKGKERFPLLENDVILMIKECIIACLKLHPSFSHFRTIPFVYNKIV